VSLTITVFGRPAPQGSKRYVGGNRAQGGRFIEASKYLPAWRKAITTAAIAEIENRSWAKSIEPIEIEVIFYLERPATVSVAKRPWPIKPPDLDKLLRGVLDGMTDAGVWDDDGQVVKITAWKVYADTREPGALIKISPLFDTLGLGLP
jgi:crossover junction endodeoxyribonuclease RusA